MNLSILSNFQLVGELMMYVLAILMLMIIIMTRPVNTRTVRICKAGLILSILTITSHVHILWIISDLGAFTKDKFLIFYLIYGFMYIAMLDLIMLYIELLSYKNRQRMTAVWIKIALINVLYLIIIAYPIVANKIDFAHPELLISNTLWQNVIPVCGLIDAFFCFVSSLKSLRRVSRVVATGTMTFTPLIAAALIFQMIYPTAYIISFTYVMPFVIYYCLFHAIKFNDIVGCQSIEALQSNIERVITYRRKFVLVRVEFPQLKSREFSDVSAIIEDASSIVCRAIEHLHLSSRIYMTTDYTFTMLATVRNREQAIDLSYKITSILDTPVEVHGRKVKTEFKQITICSDKRLTDASSYISMFGYLRTLLKNDRSSECLVAEENDFTKFIQYSEAEKLVLDVRAGNNMDDDRVVCFIQPIYNIKTGTFRSGEALMRMQADGKMIFPDSFIPAAERNNCIHTLTLIMINRVCRKIKELEDENYDFDGITVNCSTLELSDLDFSTEIKDIVAKYGIKPSHLKLEITESMSALDITNLRTNMQALVEYGISFYLDDYGTGYSNLERMTSYPFKTIKFDKSLLYSALNSQKADELVRMELAFFTGNGFSTVVEGVEDEKMLNYCKEVGFDMIQGYFFSKPQPANEITHFFTK